MKLPTCEKNKVIPVGIDGLEKLPVFNYKNTKLTIRAIVKLSVKAYKSGTYLVANSKFLRKKDTAPIGSIVILEYHSGSWKHIYHAYRQIFIVEEGNFTCTLRDKIGGEDIEVQTLNLRPLDQITEEQKVEIEAEIRNSGLKPSSYDPVDEILYYFRETNRCNWEEIELELTVDAIVEKLKNIIYSELEKYSKDKRKEVLAKLIKVLDMKDHQ